MSQTITFREVAIRGSKTAECTGCGRKLRRSRKFWQTLNPFNKNAAGEQKSATEIQEELFTERRAWVDEPETCTHCKGK
jgi:hypothetical protein